MRKETGIRWLCYVLGMGILALGISLNTKTGLGTAPITSVGYCLAQLLGTNFGDMIFALYVLFVAAQIALRGRGNRLPELLQLPLSLAFSRALNLYDGWISYNSAQHGLGSNLALLLLAIVLTGLGVSMTVNMRLVPNPGDGIVAALAQRMGWEQGFSKNVFDMGCVLATCGISLAQTGRVVGIGVGTVAAMLGTGRVVALSNRLLLEKICRWAGLEGPARREAAR